MSDYVKRWGLATASLSLLVTLCGLGASGVWFLAQMNSTVKDIQKRVDTFEKVAERVGHLERRVDVIDERTTVAARRRE